MAAFAHTAWLVVEGAVVRTWHLFSLLHDSLVEARQTRTRLEADLFHNHYRLSSKNDDDLRIVN